MAKYVCSNIEDLDKLLDEDLKRQFKGLFYTEDGSPRKEAWRMFHKKMTPETMLSRFGIDIDQPTVRDAVAFDLVKLDDDSVSNDSEYTYAEHVGYSSLEYERYLLNRNFRINLVNLNPEWSNIKYRSDGEDDSRPRKRVRTVERVYQGARLSSSLLGYFKQLMGLSDEEFESRKGQIYVPFTNANDFTTEVSLIPNTHPDFQPVTARSYYDMKYRKYRRLIQ